MLISIICFFSTPPKKRRKSTTTFPHNFRPAEEEGWERRKALGCNNIDACEIYFAAFTSKTFLLVVSVFISLAVFLAALSPINFCVRRSLMLRRVRAEAKHSSGRHGCRLLDEGFEMFRHFQLIEQSYGTESVSSYDNVMRLHFARSSSTTI